MRVLMTTQPGLGHLHPMAPIAHALRQANHEVRFACAAAFRPYIEAIGFEAIPAGLDWLEAQAEQAFPELCGLSLTEQQEWFVREIFADVAAHRILPDLLRICRSWRPDVIVRSAFEFGGCIIAEHLKVPHAVVGVGFCSSIPMLEPLIGDQLAYLRSAYGLAPYPALEMLYRHLYLALLPAQYELVDFLLPPTYHAFRPALPTAGAAHPPVWLTRLPPRPTVYATLGTVFNRVPAILRTIIDGLGGEDLNLIVTTGDTVDPASLGDLPANVFVERFIPHALLLPYCDLVVGHGGANTTIQALMHGLPVLNIPLSADQPYHALRCIQLGVGRALRAPTTVLSSATSLPTQADNSIAAWPSLSPYTVREATSDLLHDPRYRQQAERLRVQTLHLPPPEQAVSLIETLAGNPSDPLASIAEGANYKRMAAVPTKQP